MTDDNTLAGLQYGIAVLMGRLKELGVTHGDRLEVHLDPDDFHALEAALARHADARSVIELDFSERRFRPGTFKFYGVTFASRDPRGFEPDGRGGVTRTR